MTTRVAVIGATGKMGRLVCDLVDKDPEYDLVARLNSASALAEMLGADVAIDLTVPAASQGVVDFAVDNGIRVLVGTSGWSQPRIDALAHKLKGRTDVGAVIIPNFSLGSVLGTAFAALAARFFDSVEIVEAHQSSKVDSPSGTAVRTAELMAAARAGLGPVAAPHVDQRARGQVVATVPVHSLRLAGVLARQDVIFGGAGETLTITHNTQSVDAYERGILVALAATRDCVGVTVGLDQLIDLGLPAAPAEPAPAPVVPPARPEEAEMEPGE
jgi:4-hydroxy-tetrahydrodipicolinate reductase